MKNLKIILFFVLIGIVLSLAVKAEGITSYPTYTKGEFLITSDLLIKAGYTDVKEKVVSQAGNYFKNFYFNVFSTPGDVALEWAENDNLVSIFVRKMPQDWVYNNGGMKVENLYAKTMISASKSGYYFVVIGPDQAKALKLYQNLQSYITKGKIVALEIKDCGSSDSCFENYVKTCTSANATISNQGLTYIETVIGPMDENCVLKLVYTQVPASIKNFLNQDMTCNIPKENISNFKEYLQGEAMKQACYGPLAELLKIMQTP